MTVTITSDDLSDFLTYLQAWPKQTTRALALAINDTMRDVALPRAREIMYGQVNFPAGYLEDPDHLDIEQFAQPEYLVGIIAGRDRPTSLARFATAAPGPQTGRWTPVGAVEVHPGEQKFGMVGRAFIIPLRAGSVTGGNVGLAIKLRKGERLHNIREFTPIQIFPDVYILYGPSVDQVFRGVAADLVPEVTSALEKEFHRQFERLMAENARTT